MAYDPTYLGVIPYAGSKGACQTYVLDTVDVAATITAAGYISDGILRGMQLGDPVLVRKYNALPAKATLSGTAWWTVTSVASGVVTIAVQPAVT
jgi:hypothetical protein